MPNLDSTLKRPAFIEGIDKEASNKSTGFSPIPAYKYKSLETRKVVRASSYFNQGPIGYQYPDFELLKQQELERLGQKVYISPESLSKPFEINITGDDGIVRRKVLNLGEVLLSTSATLQALLTMKLNPPNSLNNQTMALLFSSLGRSAGVENVSVWFDENSRNIINDFNSLIIKPDFLNALPINEEVKRLITPNSIGLGRNIINEAFLRTGAGNTSAIKLGKIVFYRIIQGDFDSDAFRNVVLAGILAGRNYDLTANVLI